MQNTTQDSDAYQAIQGTAVEKVVQRCTHYGWKAVALYGAGKHSARLLDGLARRSADIQIKCLLDDHKAGSTLADIPVVTPSEWRRFGIQAIVISSDSLESTLYRKAQSLQPNIPIIRLYATDWPSVTPKINKLLEDIIDLPADMHKAGTMMAKVLEAIVRLTRDMSLNNTVETGSGKTTLLLSHLSKRHLVFSMDAGNQSITSVKASLLLNKACVEWIEGPTQLTLPKYTFFTPLDFALIDGPHAYPFPDMEYYFIYPHLRPGAWLVVDDIHIPTITNLFNFLKEEEMFELEELVMTTAFFRRTDKVTFPLTYDGWWWQHYNRNHFPVKEHPSVKEIFCRDSQTEIQAWLKQQQ